MDYITGQTITEIFLSTDSYNNPITPANLSGVTFKDGLEILSGSVSFNLSLVDSNIGAYSFSITPLTAATYQVYINNITTNTLYVSNVYLVSNTSVQPIYIGI